MKYRKSVRVHSSVGRASRFAKSRAIVSFKRPYVDKALQVRLIDVI
jgi:hypothetical protein